MSNSDNTSSSNSSNDAKSGWLFNSPKPSLDQIRVRIDTVDQEIHRLLNERATLAEHVAISKKTNETNPLFYRPEREAQVLRAVMARNEGPLSGETVARIFREIMSACLALEAPQTVAYLGPQGTFTQAAALCESGSQ